MSGTTKHSSHVGSAPGLESKEEPNGGHCFWLSQSLSKKTTDNSGAFAEASMV